jgi:hypothetical protein
MELMALAGAVAASHGLTILTVGAPFISAYLTWVMAHKKLKMEQDAQTAHQDAMVHDETANQTDAWTRRFDAFINAAEARNKDLYTEVMTLRREVVLLRKALDRRTSLCSGCDKLQYVASEAPYGST